MTSQTIPGFAQQDLEGRSVRDVVASSPGLVNDAWCRKILHKILQSLELQYAMQMPHRVITLDTVAFHANGEPLLLSEDIDAAPAPDAHQAEDLTALARVIHYAITRETVPAGLLDGRAAGYSAALVAAVDACMDPDPARRPRSIDAVRALLDPPAGAPPLPPVPAAVVAIAHTGMRRGRRWAIAAGGSAVALALVLVAGAFFRDGASSYPIVPTQPPASAGSLPAAPGDAALNAAASPAAGASSMETTQSGDGVDQHGVSPSVPPADVLAIPMRVPPKPDRAAAAAPVKRAATADAHAAAPPRAVSANASYQLQIKPWGTVYVDGALRGVSPPLKHLTLPPGRHTVRITHPDYRDSVLEFDSAHSTSNGKITVDFNNELP